MSNEPPNDSHVADGLDDVDEVILFIIETGLPIHAWQMNLIRRVMEKLVQDGN